MALSKFLDPKNDVAFRRIFGTEKNKDILIHFLNDILGFAGKSAIQDIEFLSTVQDPDIASKKQSIVDILCKDSQGLRYIVEMQFTKTKGFEKRAQYYAAKAYSSQADQGDEYHNLKEIIFIAVADCIIFPDKAEYKSNHVILDKDSFEHDLRDIYFTFIELPKFKKTKEDQLENIIEKWCFFFRYAAETTEEDLDKIVGSDVIIKRAYEEMNKFNWSEQELLAYEQRKKRLMDEIAALAEKFDEGKIEGKIEVGTIVKFTGLSLDEIEKLIVKVSLCNDFDINTKDEFGFTQLHHAVDEGDLRAVKLLISKGASIYVKDKCGQTPFQLAKELEIKRDYSLYERKEIIALLANAHSNKQYEQKPLTIIDIGQSSRKKSGNNKLEYDTISSGKYDKLQNLQFKSQYAIDLVASYMNKSADIIDKSENIEVSYNSETQLPQIQDNELSDIHSTKAQLLQKINDLIKTYLIEAKRLQDEIVDNREDISFVSTTDSELQITDVSSSTIDDDSQVMNSKIVSSNQQQKTSTTKKAMYATMIASPFIAVGVYTAVALSAGIAEFNPIVAAGIFVGVATLAVMCFAIIKFSEKVSEEKGRDPNINLSTAFKNALTLECFRSSETAIPDPVYVN